MTIRSAADQPSPLLIGALRGAIGHTGSVEVLPDTGLAHLHVRLLGSGLLARIPKQSQMGLEAEHNLRYQAACYRRAADSGHVPHLASVVWPTSDLPRGALLVEEIRGTPACSASHIEAIVTALARIHALPVPAGGEREPLLNEADPVDSLLEIIEDQGRFLDDPGVSETSRRIVRATIHDVARRVAGLRRPPARLIAFDAHPGNFLLTSTGKAILVDLEKARYSYPPLDLAHATLYTSTTWGPEASFVLSRAQIIDACQVWRDVMGDAAASYLPWLAPLRTMMWLWSITWCAKWLALAPVQRKISGHGEDWSADNSDVVLVRHVRERVEHYLAPGTVERIAAELDDLKTAW